MPYHSEPELERLPRPERERLLRGRTKDGERQHFLGLLMGEDAEWVESLMREGVIDSNDVLHGLAGVHGDEFTERQPQFEAIAPVLLDAGIAPEAIASTAEFGVGWGEDSARYDQLREYFTGLAVSDNPRLARIGDAGRTRYERLQAAAASAERRAHIERRD